MFYISTKSCKEQYIFQNSVYTCTAIDTYVQNLMIEKLLQHSKLKILSQIGCVAIKTSKYITYNIIHLK